MDEVIVPKVPNGNKVIVPTINYTFSLPIGKEDKIKLRKWSRYLSLDELLETSLNDGSNVYINVITYRANESWFNIKYTEPICYYEDEDDIEDCLVEGKIFDIRISFRTSTFDSYVDFILSFRINNQVKVYIETEEVVDDMYYLIKPLINEIRKEVKDFLKVGEHEIFSWEEGKEIFQELLLTINKL